MILNCIELAIYHSPKIPPQIPSQNAPISIHLVPQSEKQESQQVKIV